VEKLTPEERVRLLEERLAVSFPDPALALAAVTHKSWANEHKAEGGADNERLEFLGDAVVDLGISHRLMERFPAAHEGELSKLRALVVNEEALAKVARSLRLGELLLLGRGEELTGGREKSSVLADALEAVLGALYLGLGMGRVMEVVDTLFADLLAGLTDGRSGQDWKTHLQERAQVALRVSPRYRVVAESGPDHVKVFEVEVAVGDALCARATGRNKKEAEQAAAKQALVLLEQLAQPG
jgi:ribonuclease-3